MKPWRDILPHEDYLKLVSNEGKLQEANVKTALWGKSDQQKALRQIGDLIGDYHSLAKTELGKLGARHNLLMLISQTTANYLGDYGVDLNSAATRTMISWKAECYNYTRTATGQFNKIVKVGGKDTPQPVTTLPPGADKILTQTNVFQESLNRNLLTLQRRAERKAKYIEALFKYCVSNQPGDFARYVSKEVGQKRENGLLGIASSNMAESEDFAHRDGYYEGILHEAYQEWSGDPGLKDKYFFLWLEGHPVCLSQDRTGKFATITQVKYVMDPNSAENAQAKFQILYLEGGLLKMLNGSLLMDTFEDGYTTESRKAISRPWANGLAAYVWTPTKELFIAEHRAGKFHHSSLLAGAMVRCAGMIGIRRGKIVELSNNSGHYKPGIGHMWEFCSYYQFAFDTVHEIIATTGPGQGKRGTVNQFLNQFQEAKEPKWSRVVHKIGAPTGDQLGHRGQH